MELTEQQKVGFTEQQKMDLLKRKNRVEITTLPRVEDVSIGQYMWYDGKFGVRIF